MRNSKQQLARSSVQCRPKLSKAFSRPQFTRPRPWLSRPRLWRVWKVHWKWC